VDLVIRRFGDFASHALPRVLLIARRQDAHAVDRAGGSPRMLYHQITK
jgi:hypothetical protein